jgi:hypothetical protein
MAENPIPGNPERLRDLARRLEGGGRKLKSVRVQLHQFEDDRDWKGLAANEFRKQAGGLPKQLAHAETRFRGTARALRPYAETLEEAQHLAGRGQQKLTAASRDRDRARGLDREPRAAAKAADAQEAVDAAEGQIARAKEMVEEAAGRCAAAIAQAIDDPLKDPDDWLSDLEKGAKELGRGVLDNTLGAAAKSLGALLQDPIKFARGALDNAIDMVNVFEWGTFKKSWTAFGKDFVAWDDVKAGRPLRATGKIAVNLAGAFGAVKLGMHLLRRRGRRSDTRPSKEPAWYDYRPAEPLTEREFRKAHRKLMKEHRNPKGLPLSKAVADRALDGPPGTRPEVRGQGTRDADIYFRSGDGDVVLRREVGASKSEHGITDKLKEGGRQVHGDGDVFLQVKPENAGDVDGWVRRWQGRRTDDQLRKYEKVVAKFYDSDGEPVGTYHLGQRHLRE